MAWSTTASRSAVRVSRSTWSGRRAPNPSMILAASWRRRLRRRSTTAWTRRRAGWNTAAPARVAAATTRGSPGPGAGPARARPGHSHRPAAASPPGALGAGWPGPPDRGRGQVAKQRGEDYARGELGQMWSAGPDRQAIHPGHRGQAEHGQRPQPPGQHRRPPTRPAQSRGRGHCRGPGCPQRITGRAPPTLVSRHCGRPASGQRYGGQTGLGSPEAPVSSEGRRFESHLGLQTLLRGCLALLTARRRQTSPARRYRPRRCSRRHHGRAHPAGDARRYGQAASHLDSER